LNRLATPVAHEQAIIDAHLAAPSMPTEVVVIVENENASPRIAFTHEVRGGESADASTHDEHVDFAFNGQSAYVEARTVTKCVCSHR
jgi:hypothetical protein